MFPHFIASVATPGKRAVLWQKDHYHYEIEFSGEESKAIPLNDTSYEDALKRFNELTKSNN